MSELGNYIELLLHHELKTETKDLLASWIKEVEVNLVSKPQGSQPMQVNWQPPGPKQAASTLALMAKHGDIPNLVPAPDMPVIPEPVVQIAQTPLAAAAMNSRNQAISESINGKIDKTTGRPKKW